jgi:hypothetical protein
VKTYNKHTPKIVLLAGLVSISAAAVGNYVFNLSGLRVASTKNIDTDNKITEITESPTEEPSGFIPVADPTPEPTDTPVVDMPSEEPTAAPVPTQPPTPEPTPIPTPSTKYRNGNYNSTKKYTVPGHDNDINITLNIAGDTVTGYTVSHVWTGPVSKTYLDNFDAAIGAQVTGKPLDNINIGNIGGASLTSVAFGQAVSQIRSQAL